MRNHLAAVTDRINLLLARLERGDYPDRARLEDTLTDGYACALSLDAECGRIERRIAEHAAQLTGEKAGEHARELLALSRLLSDRRTELDSLRDLLAQLRAGVQEARVA
ncbi:MAG: hypothetical protein ACRDNH_02000 [Gaiellaceae bacterium]